MRKPRVLLLAIVVVIQWFWLARAVPQIHGNDFGIFYRSAASATPYAGDAGNPTTESGQLLTNLNPPHFLFVIKPFTLLPFTLACFVWWMLSFALLAAGMTWWLRAQGESWTAERIIWALLWAPVTTMGYTGQVTAILGVPLWLAYRETMRGRGLRAGVLTGIVLSVKPILWPLALWYLARRAWSTIAGMAIGSLGAVAAGIIVFGVGMYQDWIGALRGIAWGAQLMNASLAGTATRLPFKTPILLWTALGAALALWTVWRMREQTLDRSWMPLVAASLLASPLGWVYYGAWLLPGTRIKDWTRPVALAWCAPLIAVGLVSNLHQVLWATVGSWYGLTLLALWHHAVSTSDDHLCARTTQSASRYEVFQPFAINRPAMSESRGMNAQ